MDTLRKIINGITRFIDEPHEKLIFVTLFILGFGGIHYIISIIDEKSYNKKISITDAIYFSSTSLFTLGFGDIYPVRNIARFFVILQAYLFWLVVIIN
jgi:hypothetical protein